MRTGPRLAVIDGLGRKCEPDLDLPSSFDLFTPLSPFQLFSLVCFFRSASTKPRTNTKYITKPCVPYCTAVSPLLSSILPSDDGGLATLVFGIELDATLVTELVARVVPRVFDATPLFGKMFLTSGAMDLLIGRVLASK